MDFKKSEVEIGSEKVEVREMSARHRMVLFDLYKADTNAVLVQANVVQMGCPKYSAMDVDLILDELTGGALDKLSKEIMTLSGLNVEEMEEAEKN
jgi:hypothetical protein